MSIGIGWGRFGSIHKGTGYHGEFRSFFSFLKQNIGMIPCTGFAVCNEYGFLEMEGREIWGGR